MQPTFSGKRGIRVQDLMVVHILNESAKQMDENGKWKYPIYFATTVSPSNMVNLNRYLKMEGLLFRVGSRQGEIFNYGRTKITSSKNTHMTHSNGHTLVVQIWLL
jgi:hypothetical protein